MKIRRYIVATTLLVLFPAAAQAQTLYWTECVGCAEHLGGLRYMGGFATWEECDYEKNTWPNSGYPYGPCLPYTYNPNYSTGSSDFSTNRFIKAPLSAKLLYTTVMGGGAFGALGWALNDAKFDAVESAAKAGIAGVALGAYISWAAHTSRGGPGARVPFVVKAPISTALLASASYFAATYNVPKEMEEEKAVEAAKLGALVSITGEIITFSMDLIRKSHVREDSKNSVGFSIEQSLHKRVKFAFVPFPVGNGKLGWTASAQLTW